MLDDMNMFMPLLVPDEKTIHATIVVTRLHKGTV